VGVYGVSFGVLAVAAGLSPAQAWVMSMLVFTGASQFAFVGVIAAGGSAMAAMGPAVMLATRNAAYGLSLASILPARLRDRALMAQLVIDESTAMARAEGDPATARRAFLATGVSVWICWNLGTFVGARVGGGLGDPRALGLDAMFPAAFLALLAPQLLASSDLKLHPAKVQRLSVEERESARQVTALRVPPGEPAAGPPPCGQTPPAAPPSRPSDR